jgi:hypothetical protein
MAGQLAGRVSRECATADAPWRPNRVEVSGGPPPRVWRSCQQRAPGSGVTPRWRRYRHHGSRFNTRGGGHPSRKQMWMSSMRAADRARGGDQGARPAARRRDPGGAGAPREVTAAEGSLRRRGRQNLRRGQRMAGRASRSAEPQVASAPLSPSAAVLVGGLLLRCALPVPIPAVPFSCCEIGRAKGGAAGRGGAARRWSWLR